MICIHLPGQTLLRPPAQDISFLEAIQRVDPDLLKAGTKKRLGNVDVPEQSKRARTKGVRFSEISHCRLVPLVRGPVLDESDHAEASGSSAETAAGCENVEPNFMSSEPGSPHKSVELGAVHMAMPEPLDECNESSDPIEFFIATKTSDGPSAATFTTQSLLLRIVKQRNISKLQVLDTILAASSVRGENVMTAKISPEDSLAQSFPMQTLDEAAFHLSLQVVECLHCLRERIAARGKASLLPSTFAIGRQFLPALQFLVTSISALQAAALASRATPQAAAPLPPPSCAAAGRENCAPHCHLGLVAC